MGLLCLEFKFEFKYNLDPNLKKNLRNLINSNHACTLGYTVL